MREGWGINEKQFRLRWLEAERHLLARAIVNPEFRTEIIQTYETIGFASPFHERLFRACSNIVAQDDVAPIEQLVRQVCGGSEEDRDLISAYIYALDDLGRLLPDDRSSIDRARDFAIRNELQDLGCKMTALALSDEYLSSNELIDLFEQHIYDLYSLANPDLLQDDVHLQGLGGKVDHQHVHVNREEEFSIESVAKMLPKNLSSGHLIVVRESLDGLALKSIGMLIESGDIKKAAVFSDGRPRRHVLRHMVPRLSELEPYDVENRSVFIDDTSGLSLSGLRQRARRMIRRDEVTLFVVLGLPDGVSTSSTSRDAGDPESVVWHRDLKRLAVETNTAFVVLTSALEPESTHSDFVDGRFDLMCR